MAMKSLLSLTSARLLYSSTQCFRWARRFSNELPSPDIASDLERKTTSIACLSKSSLALDFSSVWFAHQPPIPRITGMQAAAKILEKLSTFFHTSRSTMTRSCGLDQGLCGVCKACHYVLL